MSMFIEPYFYWKDIYSRDYDISLITEKSDVINEVGIPYSRKISESEDLGHKFYEEEENETEEITLSLCLERDNEALVWTDEIYDKIVNWLISDDFEEFRSLDNLSYIYYFKVVKIQKRFTPDKTGWIDVTFKPFSNYAYKRTIIKEKVNGEKIINVYNELKKDYYNPLIIIENFESNNGTIQINNFLMENIHDNEIIYIDNEMKNVQNGKDENLLSLCNRKWIRLKPGENQLFLYGNYNIEIICEFPKII